MTDFCDLHTHSVYSDGTWHPAAIVAEAERLGLSAVALTDHNTLAGLPEFLAAARGSGVEAIAGVEVSTGYQGRELHIVGLFLESSCWEETMAFLDIINRRKEKSNRDLVARLQAAGFPLDYDTIRRDHPGGTVNRAVIAGELTKKGCTDSPAQAFDTLLKPVHGFFVPPERIDSFGAISFLRRQGAVPVLAHPFLNLTEEMLRSFLPEAKGWGLAGMETVYSAFSPEESAAARRIAGEFGLLESGGSDFHGDIKPDIRLGIGKGQLCVPAAFARELKELRIWPGN